MKTEVIKVIVREDGTMCVTNFEETVFVGSDDVSDIVEEVRDRIYKAFGDLTVKE